MNLLRSYWFPLSALAISVLAALLRSSFLAQISPSVVIVPLSFFLGLKVSRNHLRTSFHEPGAFFLTLLWIFVVFPLVSYGLLRILAWLSPALADRVNPFTVLALSFIPSTVSSCILMTVNAGGNGARSASISIFSNIIGTLATPLLLGVFLEGVAFTGQLTVFMLPTAKNILLPYCLGLFIRVGFEKRWPTALDRFCSVACNAMVLTNIFLLSTRAKYETLFSEISATLLFMVCIYPLIVFLALRIARSLRMSFESEVSFIMVGNQKSLFLGSAIFGIYYQGNTHALAPIMLTLVIFNVWQFFVTGILQSRYKRRVNPTQ